MQKQVIGREGELLCISELQKRNWRIDDLNITSGFNAPNSDIKAEKEGQTIHIQVKASRKPRSYITGGSVNPTIINGGPIFNRSAKGPPAEFVIFISNLGEHSRFFICRTTDAEKLFRINVDAYWLTPKLDGTRKRPYGQCDIFVGSGKFPHSKIVPDQRDDVLFFENRWDLLEYA